MSLIKKNEIDVLSHLSRILPYPEILDIKNDNCENAIIFVHFLEDYEFKFLWTQFMNDNFLENYYNFIQPLIQQTYSKDLYLTSLHRFIERCSKKYDESYNINNNQACLVTSKNETLPIDTEFSKLLYFFFHEYPSQPLMSVIDPSMKSLSIKSNDDPKVKQTTILCLEDEDKDKIVEDWIKIFENKYPSNIRDSKNYGINDFNLLQMKYIEFILRKKILILKKQKINIKNNCNLFFLDSFIRDWIQFEDRQIIFVRIIDLLTKRRNEFKHNQIEEYRNPSLLCLRIRDRTTYRIAIISKPEKNDIIFHQIIFTDAQKQNLWKTAEDVLGKYLYRKDWNNIFPYQILNVDQLK